MSDRQEPAAWTEIQAPGVVKAEPRPWPVLEHAEGWDVNEPHPIPLLSRGDCQDLGIMIEFHFANIGGEVLNCLQWLPLPAKKIIPLVHVHNAAGGACGKQRAVPGGAERNARQGTVVHRLVDTLPCSKIPVVNMPISTTA